MAENIPPATDGSTQSIAEVMRTVVELAEKISKSRVRGRNNGLILAQNSQANSLDEEDEGEDGNNFDERGAKKKIEQTLDILDAKGLHSVMEHSHSADPSRWEITEDPTVLLTRAILSYSGNKDNESNRSIERRYVIYDRAIVILNDGKILSNKASESLIAILLSELNAGQHLWEKFPQFIDSILGNLRESGSKAGAFELLPALWGRIIGSSNDKTYETLCAEDYLSSVLNRLCKIQWDSKSVVNVTRSLRDIPALSNEQASRLMNKVSKQMKQMELQAIPPLVYQMLLFTSKYKKTVPHFWEGISSYFETMGRQFESNLSTSSSTSARTAISNGQLRNIEGTVLLHFNFSIKQDQRLGDAFIKYFQNNSHLSLHSSFSAAVMMSIARIRRFQDSIISSLYDSTYKNAIAYETSKRREWIYCFSNGLFDESHYRSETSTASDGNLKPYISTIKHSLNSVIENGVMGWDHVIPSLLHLSFRYLECGASNPMIKTSNLNAVHSTVLLGMDILKSVFCRYSMARGEILEAIATSICTQSPATLRYISLMKILSDAYPNLVLEHTALVKMMVECLGRLSESGSFELVSSMRKLVVLKAELKDYIVLISRKSLFQRSIESRVSAVSSLLALLPGLKVQRDVYDISACLKKVLSQEVPVKEVLYSKAIDAPLSLLGVLWRHLQKYIDRKFVAPERTSSTSTNSVARPIDIDLCINANGQRVEPVAHLIQACYRCALRLNDMDNVGDGSGGVGCGEATHILGSLRKLCIAFAGENCEVEDFGLDKGSEFNGLSSIAQKNVQRAILLDECCQALIEFIGRDLDRGNVEAGAGSSTNGAANNSQFCTPLKVKHLEGIIRFRLALTKIAKGVFEASNKSSTKNTRKKATRDLSSKAKIGEFQKSLGDPLSAVKILVECQKQSSSRGEWLWKLRAYSLDVVSDSMEKLVKRIATMQKKSFLECDLEFTNNVQYMLHFAGSVMIKEFNLHHTKNVDHSEDADDDDEENKTTMKKKAKDREIVAVKALHTFFNILKAIDLLPDTFNKRRDLAIALNRTFPKGNVMNQKSSSQDNGNESQNEESDDDVTIATQQNKEDFMTDYDEINEAISRGYNKLRRLASISLRAGDAQISLESLECVLLLSKYCLYDTRSKEWIQNTCNGETILHQKIKRSNKVIAKLLEARKIIFLYDYIQCTINTGKNNNCQASVMEATKSLGQSILSISKYFDGAELTQNEDAENSVRMLETSMIGCATKDVLLETTKCLEDAEWGLNKLRSINSMKTYRIVDDDKLDDDDDDGTEAEKTRKSMLARRENLMHKLKLLMQLGMDIALSLRPMINIDLDMIIKERLLRLVIKFFKFANSLAKFLSALVKSDPSIFGNISVSRSLRNLVTKISGRENSLSKELYTQLTALHRLEENESTARKKRSADALETMKAKQVLRQSKIIPDVVYGIETLEASLLTLSKTKINDRAIFKFDIVVARGTARDFRIMTRANDSSTTASSSHKRKQSSDEEGSEDDSSGEENSGEDISDGSEEDGSDLSEGSIPEDDTAEDRRKTMLVVSGGDEDPEEDEEEIVIGALGDDSALQNSLDDDEEMSNTL